MFANLTRSFDCRKSQSTVLLINQAKRHNHQQVAKKPESFPLLRDAFRGYTRLLEERPVITNFLSSAFFGLTSDLICQFIVEKKTASEFDFKRCFGMTSFCAVYASTISLRVFAMYPKILPKAILKKPLFEGITSAVLDNLVHSPLLYLPVFYVWTGMVSGATFMESLHTYKDQFLPCMSALLLVWMPIQTVNFGFVPRSYRVVFVCAGNLVWNSCLDYLHHNYESDSTTLF